MTKKFIFSSIARVLLVVFTTNICFAHKPEENLYASIPVGPSAVAIPPSFPSALRSSLKSSFPKASVRNPHRRQTTAMVGIFPSTLLSHVNIRSSHQGKSGRTVLLLEDVHLNKEAQTHLSAAIKSIGEMPGRGPVVVGLEGGSGKFLFEPYQNLSNREVATLVADSFLETAEISGPAHAGFTSYNNKEGEKGLHFSGIEDETLYNQNVAAYKNTRTLLPSVQKDLAKEKQTLQNKKKNIFNRALLQLDVQVESYQKGTLPLGDYLNILTVIPAKAGIQSSNLFQKNAYNLDSRLRGNDEPDASLNVDVFLQAYEMEKTLRLDLIEAERSRVLEKLVQKMNQEDLNGLVQVSLAYQEGTVPFADYYDHLKNVCKKFNIDLRQTPHFDDYIRYVLLTDGIKTEALLRETTELEKSAYAALAQNQTEKELIQQSRKLYLSEQLVNFSMTSHQWEEYESLEAVTPAEAGAQSLLPFKQFYSLADKRSVAMVENLLNDKRLDSVRLRTDPPLADLRRNDDISVLVAGGFHTAELTTLLETRDISYIVASPKITKIETENAAHYLSVFDREKTSLEKIFTGQKLFMAPPPAPTEITAQMAQSYQGLSARAQGAVQAKLMDVHEAALIDTLGFHAAMKVIKGDNTALESLSREGRARTIVLGAQEKLFTPNRFVWTKNSERLIGPWKLINFVERPAFHAVRKYFYATIAIFKNGPRDFQDLLRLISSDRRIAWSVIGLGIVSLWSLFHPYTAALPILTAGALVLSIKNKEEFDSKHQLKSISFSPDGSKILTLGETDEYGHLWDATTKKLIAKVGKKGAHGSTAVFSQDGKSIFIDYGTNIGIWDIAEGKLIQSFGFKRHHYITQFDGLAISPDESLAAFAEQMTVVWVDMKTGRILNYTKAHNHIIQSIAFSPDGKFLATTGMDGKICIWNTRTGWVEREMSENFAPIYQVVFNHDGTILASASDDNTVRLWNPTNGKLIRTFNLHEGVYTIAISHNGKFLAAAGRDSISLWEIQYEDKVAKIENNGGPNVSLAFSPDGKFLASTEHWDVVLWEMPELLRSPTPQNLPTPPNPRTPPQNSFGDSSGTWFAASLAFLATLGVLLPTSLSASHGSTLFGAQSIGAWGVVGTALLIFILIKYRAAARKHLAHFTGNWWAALPILLMGAASVVSLIAFFYGVDANVAGASLAGAMVVVTKIGKNVYLSKELMKYRADHPATPAYPFRKIIPNITIPQLQREFGLADARYLPGAVAENLARRVSNMDLHLVDLSVTDFQFPVLAAQTGKRFGDVYFILHENGKKMDMIIDGETEGFALAAVESLTPSKSPVLDDSEIESALPSSVPTEMKAGRERVAPLAKAEPTGLINNRLSKDGC